MSWFLSVFNILMIALYCYLNLVCVCIMFKWFYVEALCLVVEMCDTNKLAMPL